jgi:hypothetical protein
LTHRTLRRAARLLPLLAAAACGAPTPRAPEAADSTTTATADTVRHAPRFEEYPVADTSFAGVPAPADLESAPRAREFRTMLRLGAAEGPNFAGHYTIVTWGCGTECQEVAVVDARTGAVTFLPGIAELGVRFRRDSRLLAVNPPENAPEQIEARPPAHYFTWTASTWQALE